MSDCRKCGHEFTSGAEILGGDDQVIMTACPKCHAPHSQVVICRECGKKFTFHVGQRRKRYCSKACDKGWELPIR